MTIGSEFGVIASTLEFLAITDYYHYTNVVDSCVAYAAVTRQSSPCHYQNCSNPLIE